MQSHNVYKNIFFLFSKQIFLGKVAPIYSLVNSIIQSLIDCANLIIQAQVGTF